MPITHDGLIHIATGRSRKETKWKNEEIKWSALVKKVSKTVRTGETLSDYLAATKDRQAEIKDQGGFVGGYLTKGVRSNESVLHRQLLTLDIDFTKTNLFENFQMLYDCAAAVYSTHKHTPEAPRLRLLIPLSRPVDNIEYTAIARRIAADLDIEAFEGSTFRPAQLMYWPSTSTDGKFYFGLQDGPWLNADRVLARYQDYKDISEWPVSARERDKVQSDIKKQGDPLEKPGVIGAWCRQHTLTEVIEKYLGDVYEPVDNAEERYTYKEGSTSGGLVVYDDKYAYSHHGTDPAGGKLCNAFDLVRIHKFGDLDGRAKPDTPGHKLPSFIAMSEFCVKDRDVRIRLGKETLSEAKDVFSKLSINEDGDIINNIEGIDNKDIDDSPDEKQEVNDDWLGDMDVDKKGRRLQTINNVSLILDNDPKLAGRFMLDEFRMRKMVMKSLPWQRVKAGGRILKDEDLQNLYLYLEKKYEIVSRPAINDAFATHIDKHGYHPVKDYIKDQIWDGVRRVDTLLIDYMGAEDSDYLRAVTRKTLVAAVARVFRPGVKFDYVLTLVGEEGLGKSSLAGKLGGKWFSDTFSFHMLRSKEAYEQIIGYWIIEISELNGLKKAELDGVKHFISKQFDSFRPAYGRNTIDFPRQCVFIGSTNSYDFLRGQEGNRRFWPVSVWVHKPAKNVFRISKDEIDQIWAEAYEYFLDGETLYLPKEIEKIAKEVQLEHTEKDIRVSTVQKFLDMPLPDDWYDMDIWARRQYMDEPTGNNERDRVCIHEIWETLMRGDVKDLTIIKAKEIHNLMKQIPGWVEHKNKMKFKAYGVVRGYIKNGVAKNE